MFTLSTLTAGLIVYFMLSWQAESMTVFHKSHSTYNESEVEVFLVQTYICGEEQRKLGTFTQEEIEALQQAHPEWELKSDNVFVEHIEDLSPHCKENGFFGVDTQGNLSLFDGPPADRQVIQTFFQIDLEYLESSLPQTTVDQLYNGIPIHDLEEYHSVLATFSDYAIKVSNQSEMSPKKER